MVRYQDIKTKAYRILDLTSLTIDEFEQLVPPFEAAFVRHMRDWTMEGKPRTARAYTPYANSPLPTRRSAVVHFELSQGSCTPGRSRGHVWHVAIQCEQMDSRAAPCAPPNPDRSGGCAGPPPRGAATTPRRSGQHSAGGRCGCASTLPFFHDGTERPITRPKDPDEPSATYSGKKRRHTVKNVLLATGNGTVPFLSDTYEGSRHDKPIADQTPLPLPDGSELLQDLGFVGFSLAGVVITQPHKKPRGQALTDAPKAENRAIARRRVLIEHIICSIKRCRIVKDTIRLWKDTARDMVMAVCCGLHNFRLRLCPWPSLTT